MGNLKNSGPIEKLNRGEGRVATTVSNNILLRASKNKHHCVLPATLDFNTRKALTTIGFNITETFEYDGFTSYHSGYKISWS